jgi:hypothetical protein
VDPLAPGASIVCGTGTDAGSHALELYVLAAMNHKLRHHPDFATAVGADVISDCDGARAFTSKYAEYSKEHPGFDADEPLGTVPDGESPLPEDDNVPTETHKILNGTLVADHAVVQIAYQLPTTGHPSWGNLLGRKRYCSASFINKNWLLTAAHCIHYPAVYGCIARGVSVADCRPEWRHWAQWTVTRSIGGASVSAPGSWARAYAHPNWTGAGEFDVALIHLPTRDDHKLPADIENNGALRLSTVPPDLTLPMRYYGWGAGGGGKLRMGEHIHGHPNFDTLDLNFLGQVLIEATTRSATTPVICSGDSGGPLVRTDLTLDTNLERKPVEVIMAVARESTGADPNCVQLPAGQHSWDWTRIDTDITREFIETTLQRWQPYKRIPCKTHTVAPVADAVLECWGSPCAHDDDCEDSEYCFQSWNTISRSRQSCSACDLDPDSAGTCNCIVGQCVSKK